MRVEGDLVRYEARDATGELYDTSDLRKRRRGPNRLIERAPARPERRPAR